MVHRFIICVWALVGAFTLSPAVPLSESPRLERDLHKVLAKLRSQDQRERTYAKEALSENRKQMVAALHQVVLENLKSTEERDGEIVVAALLYLGKARAEEEIGLLVENLAYRVPRPSVDGPRASNSRERSLDHVRPSVRALVRIGTPSIEQVVRKVARSDDEEVAGCAARVLWDLLGSRLSTSYVTSQKVMANGTARDRLGKLLELLRKYDEYPDSMRTPREPTENVGQRIDRNDLGNRMAMDWRELTKQLRTGDRAVILGDEEVAFGITVERGYLVRGLGALIEDSTADDAKQENAKTAILLLGQLRTEGAIELLAQQITYQPRVGDGHLPAGMPVQDGFPCVWALIQIGSRAAVDVVTDRAEATNDASVIRCCAAVLYGTFGKELAILYLKVRLDSQKDANRRQRLTRLLAAVENEAVGKDQKR